VSGRRFAHLARLIGLTANPAVATGTGDIWWRSDRSQVHAADATGPIVVGPEGNIPVVRASQWHTLPPMGAAGTATVPADRLFALPFFPGRQCTLQAMAVNVTLALVGGNIRMGLYASDGTVPTTLVADYGTVTVGVTGVRSITGLSTPVRPVLHFLGVVRQGGVLNLGLSARDTWDAYISDSSAVLAENRNTYYRDTVPGALPASFGAIAGSIQGPSASVQLG
jgi:hypothetical protein